MVMIMNKLHCLSFKITKNFALELNVLYLTRKYSDGITWFQFSVESDWYKGDHNPQFGIQLIVLNITLFEFRVYNIHHIEE